MANNNNTNPSQKEVLWKARQKIIDYKGDAPPMPTALLEGLSKEEQEKQIFAWEKRKEWHDPTQWDFTRELIENWQEIRKEFENLQNRNVHPWPEKNLYQQTKNANKEEAVVESGTGWNVFGLYAFNKKHPTNLTLCPTTARIVAKIPGCSTAAFSILEPHAKILPHVGYYGYSEAILRCHLGLIVPSKEHIWLEVNGVKGGWGEGEVFVFDDTYNHSAVNNTDQRRVVLLLDFTPGWPCLKDKAQPPPQNEYLDKITTQFGYK